MRDKMRKGFAGGVFLIVCLVLFVFVEKVWAAPEEPHLPFVRAGEPTVLKYGSYVCLAFTLPEDGKMKAEMYYSNGVRMGTLYGISYYGCVSDNGLDGYEWKKGHSEELLKGMEGLELRPAYKKMYGFQGIGEPETGLPSGMDSNYLIWKGQYIPEEEQYPRYVQPGRYVIRLSPLKPAHVWEPIQMEIVVTGSGEEGALTKEDVERVTERELTDFSHEPVHVEDLFPDIEKGFVDMKNGTLWWRETDLKAEEENELKFERIYHSLEFDLENRSCVGLGNGWTHTYSYFAEIYRTDMVIYTAGGERLNYTKVYREGWQTYPGDPFFLEEGDECFLLYEPDGDVVTFDLEGHAVQIVSSDGTVTELEYEGNYLSKVSEGEKSLTFLYNGEYLSEVKDQKGRSISFQYQGNGDLAGVRTEGGNTLHYTYDEYHNLLTAADGNGEKELIVSYERSMGIGRVSLVNSFQIAGRAERTYSYNSDREGKTCTEKERGGGTRVLFSTDTYWPEQNKWSLYNKRGKLIRETEDSGKTTVY